MKTLKKSILQKSKLLLRQFVRNYVSNEHKVILRNIQSRLLLLLPERRAILAYMNKIVTERPIAIALETCSSCNARCVFCARRKIKQSNQILPMELFEKICYEYTAFGGGFIGFSPLIADPLLDPLLVDRLRMIQKNYPLIIPHIFTNGIAFSRFSDDDLSFLLSLVDHIDISLGGFNREDYRTMFGVDRFEIVWSSLKRLSLLNQQIEPPCKLQLHIRTNRKETILNSLKLKQLVDMGYKCDDITDLFSNWGGLITEDDLPKGAKLIQANSTKRRSPCFIPMMNLMIMPDGRVLACGCMDANGLLVVGNIHNSSLKDIWTGDTIKKVRNSFKQGNRYLICEKCTYYHPYEDYFSRPGLKNYHPSKNFWRFIG